MDQPDDAMRAKDLARMKGRATGLLLLATAVFLVMRLTSDGEGWTGYVQIGAEAAMIGGLADWFAVTALFRHPLGVPVPHTAIIPRRKDQIGASLGRFVQENFLDAETIRERVHDADVAARFGSWLRQPANAHRIGDQLGAAFRGATEVARDEEVAAAIEHALIARAREVEVTPFLGRTLEVSVDGGHFGPAVDAGLIALGRMVDDNEALFRERLAHESPWWIPEAVDDRIFAKILGGVRGFIHDVTSDPSHVLRDQIEKQTLEFAHRLMESPELMERGERVKHEFLDHPEVREWFASLWGSLKDSLIAASEDPDSEFRRRIELGLVDVGERLESDPELQVKVDRWLGSAAAYVAEQSRGEVADLISSTVARWDAEQTSRRIELQVGRDLQFIRINGTVVGAVAGLAIHAIAQLLG